MWYNKDENCSWRFGKIFSLDKKWICNIIKKLKYFKMSCFAPAGRLKTAAWSVPDLGVLLRDLVVLRTADGNLKREKEWCAYEFSDPGNGSAHPVCSQTNDDLSVFLDTSDEWISTRTGIKSRYVCTTETISDLAVQAGVLRCKMQELHQKNWT